MFATMTLPAGSMHADAVGRAAELADVLLGPVRVDAGAVASAVRTPDGAVLQRHDAFGPHEVSADSGHVVELDREVHEVAFGAA